MENEDMKPEDAVLGAQTGSKAASGGSALVELNASTAVDAMRKGELRAEDYANALLTRANSLQSLNAFRTLSPDEVREDARSADKVRASGAKLGLLHGLPLPVKDSVNTKSLPTSNGTRALRDFKPKEDAEVVKRLLSQGAIVMGKSNLQELSYGWTSSNDTFGSVRNPYDQACVPGGSSGGSAAAVAARMAPLAIAEDTLGSIRIPASCCGLAGLRPTFGRYPGAGIMSLTQNKFDQVGPLARSVADLALFDAAVTGETAATASVTLSGVRIGIAPDYFYSGLDPEVERVAEAAIRKLKDAGAVIVQANIPEVVKLASEIAFTIITYETVPAISEFLANEKTGLTFEEMFSQVSESMQGVFKSLSLVPNRPSAEVYEAALLNRRNLKQAIASYFSDQQIAALAFPTLMTPPPRIEQESDVVIRGENVPLGVALVRNIAVGTCASLASLILPAGVTAGGLPVGMEFDALPGEDRNLLSLGYALENALGPIQRPAI
ncbi:amidase family protein [Bradyrhizobium sp. CCBAU 53421]|uniref:amidase family protein n=1 Tax=Bradyrhizobium sp. CCBAU 53421 TaxID=1325120 RepID=UPI00188AC6F6|nr:amidase family protein [Bradyrhizobium sp. CCBAU 53421]